MRLIQYVANEQTYTLAYDAESRLVSVSGAATANFYYDGDGKPLGRACRDQVKSVEGSEMILGACPELGEGSARTTKSISPAAQSPSTISLELQE